MHLSASSARNMSSESLMGYLGATAKDSSTPAQSLSSGSTAMPSVSGTTSAPGPISSKVIAANQSIAQLMAAVPGSSAIIDHLPNPPYYTSFSRDLKVRPIDAMVGLFTPLDWLIYDIIREANAASGVHAGSARRIGLPGRQIDFVMGQSVPNTIDPTIGAYLARLNALNQFLILAYQDPVALAKGTVRAVGNAVTAGRLSAQQKIDFLTGLMQQVVAQGVALFHGPEAVQAPDNRFLDALVAEVKATNPALQILVDAQRVFQQGAAAAAAAAQQAAANVSGLARITPIIAEWNAILTLVGPQNAGLVAEVYAHGDRGIKDRADAVKSRAMAENHNVPQGIRAILDRITNGAESVKANASDMQGYKDNGHNLAAGLVKASRVGSNYQPDAAAIIGIPTTFAGARFRSMGVTGIEETLAASAILGSGGAGAAANTIVTGGTAGVATAPATTPGIGGLIQQLLQQFLGGSGVNIPGLPGASTPGPVITQQPASVTAAAGSSVTLSVAATPPASAPTTPLTYQWKKNNVDVPGATGPTLTVVAAPGAYGDDQYAVKVSAGTASTMSNPATIHVGGAAAKKAAGSNLVPIALGVGALAALPVAGPVVAAALAAGAGLTALGVGGKKKTPTAATQSGGGTIQGWRARSSDLNELLHGLGESAADVPVVTQQPMDVRVAPGGSARFEFSAASGNKAPNTGFSITWQQMPSGTSTWMDITGAHQPVLELSNVQFNGKVRARINSDIYTRSASVTVDVPGSSRSSGKKALVVGGVLTAVAVLASVSGGKRR